MSAQQPEALQLAELLGRGQHLVLVERKNAAAELRRLHAENQALNDALQYSMGCHREMSELAVRQRARLDELESQVEQVPVAWLSEVHEGGHANLELVWRGDFGAFPVFRRQQHGHAPLTDEQIAAATGAKPGTPMWLVAVSFIRAAEAAHGIK